MKSREWIYIIALVVVCYFLYDAKCTSKHETVSIPVPEKTGTFEAVKPVQTPIVEHALITPKTLGKSSILGKKQAILGLLDHASKTDSINARLLAENEILRKKFKNAPDSTKTAMHDKAIELNDFSNTFEDSVIKIDMSGKVRGEVQSIGVPKYTVKKSAIVIQKAKPKPFGIGVFVGYGTDLKPVAGVGLSYNIIRF